MKKILCLVLVVLLALGMSACTDEIKNGTRILILNENKDMIASSVSYNNNQFSALEFDDPLMNAEKTIPSVSVLHISLTIGECRYKLQQV